LPFPPPSSSFLSFVAIFEIHHIRYVIEEIILRGAYKLFCVQENDIPKVFDDLQTLVNSIENLAWLHRDENVSKLGVWKNLIAVRKSANMDGPLSTPSGVLDEDRERIRGLSIYFEKTFNIQFKLAERLFKIFKGASPVVAAMVQTSEVQFLEDMYKDMVKVAKHYQDLATRMVPNPPTPWEIPSIKDLKCSLGSGALNRRCRILASNNDM